MADLISDYQEYEVVAIDDEDSDSVRKKKMSKEEVKEKLK